MPRLTVCEVKGMYAGLNTSGYLAESSSITSVRPLDMPVFSEVLLTDEIGRGSTVKVFLPAMVI